jgi:Tol biopolymer transport system component
MCCRSSARRRRSPLPLHYATRSIEQVRNGPENVFVRNLSRRETILVRANRAGTGGGDGSSTTPAISANGRFVAFESDASDLTAHPGPAERAVNVFVRDLATGTTMLASVTSDGTASGNLSSHGPSLSANGRFVVFESDASDLVANDTNTEGDLFVRDLVQLTTTLVSVNAAGTASGNGESSAPVITPNGRFVAFQSIASDLVTTDANGNWDVFVRDLGSDTITLVSVNVAGTGSANGFSFGPVISDDGRLVAFRSFASDLVADDTNGVEDVFVRDLAKGTTTLVSVNLAGTGSGNASSTQPSLNARGRVVAFQSNASDLVANDDNAAPDVFARISRESRSCRPTLAARCVRGWRF